MCFSLAYWRKSSRCTVLSVCLRTSADFSVAFLTFRGFCFLCATSNVYCSYRNTHFYQQFLCVPCRPEINVVFFVWSKSEKYTLFFWYSWACATCSMLLFLLAILHILECASTWEAGFIKSFEICNTLGEYFCSWFSEIQFWKWLGWYFYVLNWNSYYLFILSEVIFLFRQSLFEFGVFFSEAE